MNPMWIIGFIQKRPSDTTINISRIIFWIILISSLYYNLIVQWDNISTNYFWIDVPTDFTIYIKSFFIALWVLPLIMWLTKICLLKKKWIRIIQIIFWIILFYVSSCIEPTNANKLDVDSLVWFMWIFPLIAWITWKCITSKCLKFAEKITKIRV